MHFLPLCAYIFLPGPLGETFLIQLAVDRRFVRRGATAAIRHCHRPEPTFPAVATPRYSSVQAKQSLSDALWEFGDGMISSLKVSTFSEDRPGKLSIPASS
ncbi:hypothetical protein HGRIS_014120 [Hohenbuehelia grisea]|uniref:Uncharacterized protein n=1 Tax=Hohenbuehelia grisea TaxID=104357 RepID=A0ABR3JTU9_9AGAR